MKSLFILIVLIPYLAFSQQDQLIDSLITKLNQSKNDTNTLSILNALIDNISNDSEWPKYNDMLGDLSKKLMDSSDPKIKHCAKGYYASFLNNTGYILKNNGNETVALDYYFKCLKIKEELKLMQDVATGMNNIGIIYRDQNEIEKALEYYQKSLKIRESLNDKYGIEQSLNNIGDLIGDEKGDFKSALNYFEKAIKIQEEIQDYRGLAATLNNIGHTYMMMGEFDKSLEYNKRALETDQETGDKRGLSFSLHGIGLTYFKKGDISKALQYGQEAYKIAKEIGYVSNISTSSELLYRIYHNQKQFDKALTFYMEYITMRDSIESEASRKAAIQKQFQYEYDKKMTADSIRNQEAQKVKDAEIAKQKAQLKSDKIQQIALFGGLILVLIFTGVIYNRFKNSQKQKEIIAQQKHLVDEKNKEITDSINYAKRLQQAILPPTELILQKLPNTFVLYKPKDIVAGDFYWMEQINDTILIAAADCTGHGVPGAMVSVVCSNALNRAVKEFNLINTGEILDKVTQLVVETFEKSATEVKDGMDISLLSINNKTKQIQWSGANNPLWYFENGIAQEIKADKQPIGKSDHRKPFTTHEIEYTPNKAFYLFTDGYADQFGGPKGKKLMYKRFQETITKVIDQDYLTQHTALNEEFENWKGNLEQIDDVCVIGIKI